MSGVSFRFHFLIACGAPIADVSVLRAVGMLFVRVILSDKRSEE